VERFPTPPRVLATRSGFTQAASRRSEQSPVHFDAQAPGPSFQASAASTCVPSWQAVTPRRRFNREHADDDPRRARVGEPMSVFELIHIAVPRYVKPSDASTLIRPARLRAAMILLALSRNITRCDYAPCFAIRNGDGE